MTLTRTATADDLSHLVALHAEVNESHHHAAPGIFAAAVSAKDSVKLLRPYLETEDVVALLIEETLGSPVGYACVSLVTESSPLFQRVRFGRVESLGVTAAKRGRGLGRLLLCAAESWALERGATEIHLNAWLFNHRAIHLYESLGYAPRSQYMGKLLRAEA